MEDQDTAQLPLRAKILQWRKCTQEDGADLKDVVVYKIEVQAKPGYLAQGQYEVKLLNQILDTNSSVPASASEGAGGTGGTGGTGCGTTCNQDKDITVIVERRYNDFVRLRQQINVANRPGTCSRQACQLSGYRGKDAGNIL